MMMIVQIIFKYSLLTARKGQCSSSG